MNVVFSEQAIQFKDYPFKPASVYPDNCVDVSDIDTVYLKGTPPALQIKNELVLITREQIDELTQFTEQHGLSIVESLTNWNDLLDPFLDTVLPEKALKHAIKRLKHHGFTKTEINVIREDVKEAMIIYNFDDMYWEWVSLGLYDVLKAMQNKCNEAQFENFYWRAMEIQLRGVT